MMRSDFLCQSVEIIAKFVKKQCGTQRAFHPKQKQCQESGRRRRFHHCGWLVEDFWIELIKILCCIAVCNAGLWWHWWSSTKKVSFRSSSEQANTCCVGILRWSVYTLSGIYQTQVLENLVPQKTAFQHKKANELLSLTSRPSTSSIPQRNRRK